MFDNQTNPPVPNNRPFGQAQNPLVPPQPQPMPQAQPVFSPQAASQFQPMQQSQPQPQPATAVTEDMFASVDGGAPAVNRPTSYPAGYPTTAFNQPSRPQPANPVYDQELFGGRSFPWGKIITVIIIVLVLIGIAGAGYYGFLYFQSLNKTAGTAETATTTTTTAPPVVPADTVVTPVATSTPVTTVEPEDIKDSDGDGLTDEEEIGYNTNLEVVDSDADGLTDWAEIKIYKTDPLNPDTDGDGYKDGQEVINGYDPLKPGSARLYEVPVNGSVNP